MVEGISKMDFVLERFRVSSGRPLRLGSRVLTGSHELGMVVGEEWCSNVQVVSVMKLNGGGVR